MFGSNMVLAPVEQAQEAIKREAVFGISAVNST
jgi:hypothetical protein